MKTLEVVCLAGPNLMCYGILIKHLISEMMNLTSNETHAAEAPQKPDSAIQARRRDDLIEATIDTIAEHGLSNLTLSKVAGRAGLTGAMINFHFNSKEALLAATLNRLYEEYATAVEAAMRARDTDPCAALQALVERHFDARLADPRKIAVWYAFWGEASARSDYMAICGSRDRDEDALMRALCRDVVDRDGYDAVVPDAIAAGLSGILEESWQSFLIDDSAAARQARRKTCDDFLRSVFPRSFPLDTQSRPAAAANNETAPLDDKIWDRRMLAPWTYTSAEFTELEKQELFHQRWLLVGHINEAPNPGDFLTFDAVDERALVIRGKDGCLRAFHNLCRHRASKVLAERRGTCKSAIVCPFHGWSYNLDGGLKRIPAAETFGDLDTSKLSLKGLDLEIWQGFIFIRFGGAGPSAAEHLAPAFEELAPYRLPELQPFGRYYQYELGLDWKTVMDVDNEGYHVPMAHPGLHRLVGRSYYDEVLTADVGRSFSVLRDKISRNWGEGLYQKILPEVSHLPESHRRAWLYFGYLPNLSLAFYPDMIEFFQAFPIAPGRSLIRGRAYALPSQDRAMRAARYLNGRINKQVMDEDQDVARWSAAGMQSSGFQGAILSDKEKGVRALHDLIRETIPVARLDRAPALGSVAEENRRLRR